MNLVRVVCRHPYLRFIPVTPPQHSAFETESMSEPAQSEAPAPTAMDEQQHEQLQEKQQQPPILPLEEAAPKAPEERNEELEIAIRAALDGPDKDLGRLCKTLGEKFCLAPPPSSRSRRGPKRGVVRAAGYDSGSDTTSPADQEHSSSGSETGGDHAAATTAVSGGAGCDDVNEQDEVLQAVAAAARVRCACIPICRGCLFVLCLCP